VLSGEATNTNLIVFGLTRPRLEPTIYRTRGEHANSAIFQIYYGENKLIFNEMMMSSTLF